MFETTNDKSNNEGSYAMDKELRCPDDKMMLVEKSDRVFRFCGKTSKIYQCPFCKLRYVDLLEFPDKKRFFSGNDGYINLSAKPGIEGKNLPFEELPKPVRLPSDNQKSGDKRKKKNIKGVKNVKKKTKRTGGKGGRINIHQLMQSSIPSRASTKSYIHDTDGMHL